MGLFRRRQSPDIPPLVDLPKAGEPIVFHEEEQQAIDEQVQRELDYLKHDSGGKVFPKEVTEILSTGFATDALRNVVKRRLSRSDLKGAASTSMKLFGIALEIMPSDELILAKIFALHGDSIRANNFIAAANKTFKKLRFDKMGDYSNEGWKIQVQEVMNIIDSIQR